MKSPRLRVSLVCAAIVVALCPSAARADWLLSLYAGAGATASNTLTITSASGSAVTVGAIDYEGRSWSSPPYYGYRVGWTPEGHHFGVEGEFTHAKSIARAIPTSDLSAFQLSHGLNFILGNVVYRTSPYCGGRCTFVARGGAGITYPHVEATFRGMTTYQYEYAGFGAQGGVGVELKVVPHFFVVGDARLTHARIGADLVDGGRLAGPFTTRHADIGIAWRSAR
jgi:hypothetical protein